MKRARSDYWRQRRREKAGNQAFHQLYKQLQADDPLRSVLTGQPTTATTEHDRPGEIPVDDPDHGDGEQEADGA